MASPDEEDRMRVGRDGDDVLSLDSSDSEDDLSGDEEPSSAIEWLATGRERRSTAGNRMKSMLAAEEPDDELELLFAEDADDAGFTDVEDDRSDAQMSSSEDEDAHENADELEGEKELEKQARESKQVARKRKAQAALPVKFRKKVKIDTSQTPSASVTPAPKPRPKKKSERISWLPSPADMPTRASKRQTTMAGKEQLHKQMAEREVKRLQQAEAMERKAKRMEALKKPPMTQAERLAEAALVEKRNAKSLNRWEEAEKQREEERKAKLAALNNRTLEGPVVTFWSGVGEWIGGKLKHVGKIVTIEEKPVKKKRQSTIGPEATVESPREDKPSGTNIHASSHTPAAGNPSPTSPKEANSKSEKGKESVVPSGVDVDGTRSENPASFAGVGQETQPPLGGTIETTSATLLDSPVAFAAQDGVASHALSSRGQDLCPQENASQPQILPPADIRPSDLRPPDLQPPSTNLYTTSLFAPPTQSSLMMPSELKPPSNSFLAPPMGVSQNGLSVPMIGYHPSLSSTNSSNVLAPPNPAQRQSPLSMPRTNIHPPPASTPTRPAQVPSTPKPSASSTPSITPALPHVRPSSKTPSSILKSTKANSQRHQSKDAALPPPPSPPADGKATRNCIILQNFNENAVKDKSTQTRILFDREMNKLPKQGPAIRCVITNHPAKYRDPKTGLPYYNAYAFKQIRELLNGEYKWSNLIGAWVGNGTSAAIGVPARFGDPAAPGPPKEPTPPDPSPSDDKIIEGSEKEIEPQTADKQPMQTSIPSAPQPSHIAPPVTAGQTSSNTLATTNRPGTGPSKVDIPSIATGPSSSSQPWIPTTEATFALNLDYVTTVDTPMTGSTESRTVDNISNTRPRDVVNTSTDPSGPPIAAVGGQPTLASSSLAAPAAVKQGAVNQ
ncbi:YL1 nuclear protein-domain-containing protein [Nemania diffusa]|nr:YL1 nuclear protein-domain-containing protein [Nemania diffusa]